MLNRRAFLLSSACALAAAPAKPRMIDTHVHLFARDQTRFPYHPSATYRPQPQPVEDYVPFATRAGIEHVVIVHPEPYQDDHRYLEFCFANEPSPGFFKGTCLFDPIQASTPSRMAALVAKNPGRIVALRIHENREAGVPPTTSGPIRDRDLKHPAVRATWGKAHELGLAIQMHMIPLHAPEVAALAKEFADTPVVIDHLARAGQGTPEQYQRVLDMARLKNVWMKFSGVNYSSKQPSPHRDAKPLVRRTYDAFGPDRMMWGGLGMNPAEFDRNTAMFEELLGFASEADRAKIRAGTAAKLYGFQGPDRSAAGTWNFDRLDSIGGHATHLRGHPRVIDTPLGKAVQFNGIDDAIFVDNHPLAGAETFTWEVVFRPDSNGSPEQRFFHLQEMDAATKADTQTRMLFETRIRDGRWCLDSFVNTEKGSRALLNFEKLHPLDRWHHAAMTYDGATFRNYVDGQMEGEGSLQFIPQKPGHTSVGVRINLRDYFKGAIRLARFTRRALKPGEFLNASS